MPLDPALEKAWHDLKAPSPYVAAAKSGCDFRGGSFYLPFFSRRFLISPESRQVVEEASNKAPAPWLALILLHYLITAEGTPVADRWITYRHLPGASFFEVRFHGMALLPLLRAFGRDVEGFRRAGEALGGEPMSVSGDAAFRFLAFPYLPMAIILYLGDEEVPSSVNILFDASAPHYLPTEDLSYLGSYLSSSLISLKATTR